MTIWQTTGQTFFYNTTWIDTSVSNMSLIYEARTQNYHHRTKEHQNCHSHQTCIWQEILLISYYWLLQISTTKFKQITSSLIWMTFCLGINLHENDGCPTEIYLSLPYSFHSLVFQKVEDQALWPNRSWRLCFAHHARLTFFQIHSSLLADIT